MAAESASQSFSCRTSWMSLPETVRVMRFLSTPSLLAGTNTIRHPRGSPPQSQMTDSMAAEGQRSIKGLVETAKAASYHPLVLPIWIWVEEHRHVPLILLGELEAFAVDCQHEDAPVGTRLAGRHQYRPPSAIIPTEVTEDGIHDTLSLDWLWLPWRWRRLRWRGCIGAVMCCRCTGYACLPPSTSAALISITIHAPPTTIPMLTVPLVLLVARGCIWAPRVMARGRIICNARGSTCAPSLLSPSPPRHLHPAAAAVPVPPTDLPLSLPVLRGGVKLDFRIKNNAGRPVRQQASRQVTGNPVTSQPDSKQTVNMPTCPCEQQIRVLRCCENRNQNQSSVFHCVTCNRVLSARYSLGAIDSALGSDCTLSLPVLWRGLKIDYRI